jgi:DNA-binding NtrC family response regulator
MTNQGETKSVLVVDDDETLARSCVRFLKGAGMDAHMALDLASAKAALERRKFDALVTDVGLGGDNGLDVLRFATENGRVSKMFVMSGAATVPLTVEAMRLGAKDVLEKPFDDFEFVEMIVKHLVDTAQVVKPGEDPLSRWRGKHAPELIGEDPALLRMLETLRRVADSDSNVLVLGESGTGKELVARAVHRASKREKGPYVTLNCAAIPETLVESELFGYAKGAFTGAQTARVGRFGAADGGTIFLDEVGETSQLVQAKLLRVLQDREYTPVGETHPRRCDVRVVAATNRDLRKMVDNREFREDLYFRLNVFPVRIPSLRQRKPDIPLLVKAFIARVNQKSGREVTGMTEEALQVLMAHDWPGNVRELENTVERLVIVQGTGDIGTETLRDVDFMPRQSSEPALKPNDMQIGFDLKQSVETYENELIQSAMRKSNGNQTKAAELLKINRTTLIEKLRRLQARNANA